MDTAVLLLPAPVRPRLLLDEVRRLEAEWVRLLRHCVVQPTPDNVAARQAAHATYRSAQRQAFAALGYQLPD